MTFPIKNFYLLCIIIISFITLISISNEYYNAAYRMTHYNIFWNKPLPFNLSIQGKTNKTVFRNDMLKINLDGWGELPEIIQLNWLIDNKIYNKEIQKQNESYSHIFNHINSEMKIWAEYSNKPILVYNKYKVVSDTLNVFLKERPEIKDLNITITPPKYTKIEKIEHNPSLIKIETLEGSKININAVTNKNVKWAKIIFSDNQEINMNIKKNKISTAFEVLKDSIINLDLINHSLKSLLLEDIKFEIICIDEENNKSIPIQYSIKIIDDLKPYIIINKPKNNLKLDQNYSIELSTEIIDDFGIKEVFLNHYLVKPYYLNQDSILNKKLIFNSKKNKTTEYIDYNWDVSKFNLGPGDKIFYWIEAHDNNSKTGPGITKSETLKAYFPDLEELYFEVEQEQENIVDTFDDMNESIDELKEMYKGVSQDVLKNESGLEQEQEVNKMIQELEKISEKIEKLDNTIKTIEQLNEKNNLINQELGEKIEKLQEMFKESLTPELMQALQNLQENINENDFEKSIEELNNLNFEMSDLEQKLDRMLELFEQIIIEQKLEELIKKMEEMNNLQENISERIEDEPSDNNIQAMVNRQDDNLKNIIETMEETENLMKKSDEKTAEDINQLRNSEIPFDMEMAMDNILNSDSKNKQDMSQNSNNIEDNISEMKQEMNSIISSYKKKENLEMLTKYIRIIKNLIDMSYEQELIIKESKDIKSRKDLNISIVTTKENILLEQYKNIFIQIADLSKKSFHIKPETSKSLSQIFNNISKIIAAFEQGKITTAKKHQILCIEYINKTILLLIDAMEKMQNTGTASGYSEYMEAMQELTQGQQSLNQGMMSISSMPFGQGPGAQGIMQSLMQEQKELMKKLEELMNGNPSQGGGGEDGLGKALEDMNEIIRDFENNNISQESIDRGERIYKKLLEHQQAAKTKGFDDKWETEQASEEELLENHSIFENNNTNDLELKELYKTLDGLEKNEKLSKENKIIIQEYLRILIKERLETNDSK